MTQDDHPEVGSLAEETARLLGALNGWARDHGGGLGDGLAGMREHVAAAAHEVDEHLATGAPECTVCPVCRTVHAVRQLSPEVKAHLAGAAASLAQAAAGILATVAPAEPAGASRPDGGPTESRRGDVEHIDLDEDWPTDD